MSVASSLPIGAKRNEAILFEGCKLERELAETKRLLAEASKDAERYRLLKKIATDIKWKGNHVVRVTMNCLDNSLDIAAIKEQKCS
jgi:hypothetical protein